MVLYSFTCRDRAWFCTSMSCESVFDRATLFRQIHLLLFPITYINIFKFLCISQAVQDSLLMFLIIISELSFNSYKSVRLNLEKMPYNQNARQLPLLLGHLVLASCP